MKFMILIYGSEMAFDALGPDDFKKLAAAHASVQEELREHNELIASSELDETNAHTLRTVEGEVKVVAEPFSEGTQMITGYYLVECDNQQRAIDIAGRFAEVEFAPIEVRQLSEGSTWVKLLA